MAPRALIRIAQLSHTYQGTRRSPPQEALKDVSLEVREGEIVALLGPNGSGKSTLLRILMTALEPDSGEVQIDQLDLRRQAGAVRRLLGVVFQQPALDGRMTVAENLRASGRLYGLPRRRLVERSEELLRDLNLFERRNERVEKLSGGLARRVELAKALLHRPRLLILDEPTTGLDPTVRQDFWHQLERLRAEEGLTAVVTTHLLDEAERCDRVAILHRGQLLACDEPNRLREGLGQELLSIQGEELESLGNELQRDLGLGGRVVDGTLCIPLTELISLDELLHRFGPRIRTLTLSHPSLDDVFAHFTGEHLGGREEE